MAANTLHFGKLSQVREFLTHMQRALFNTMRQVHAGEALLLGACHPLYMLSDIPFACIVYDRASQALLDPPRASGKAPQEREGACPALAA